MGWMNSTWLAPQVGSGRQTCPSLLLLYPAFHAHGAHSGQSGRVHVVPVLGQSGKHVTCCTYSGRPGLHAGLDGRGAGKGEAHVTQTGSAVWCLNQPQTQGQHYESDDRAPWVVCRPRTVSLTPLVNGRVTGLALEECLVPPKGCPGPIWLSHLPLRVSLCFLTFHALLLKVMRGAALRGW